MKYIYLKFINALIVCTLILGSCGLSGKASSTDAGALDRDASYALGMNIGMNIDSSLKNDDLSPDLDQLFLAIKDVLAGKKTRIAYEDAQRLVEEAFMQVMEKRSEVARQVEERNRQAEVEFLSENSKKPNVQITASGLQYEVTVEGKGAKPSETSKVRVNYEGSLPDGTIFDSSYNRGEPMEFQLNEVISGWAEGLQLMSVGSTYNLFIPSEMGYGSGGTRNIPPYSPLIFKVELLNIVE
jgi:FKBP-type peptidyl-prolyl cis-trans isomerase